MIWKIWLICSLFNILGFLGVFTFIKDRISYTIHPEKWKEKPEFFNPFSEPMGCATELLIILTIAGPIGTLWLISMWYADWRDTKKLIKEILEEEKKEEKEDDIDKYDIGLH